MLKTRTMFCPKCSGEYCDGVHRCVDCDVELAPGLRVELETRAVKKRTVPNDEALVEVFRTADPAMEAMIESLLIPTDIPYVISGRHSAYTTAHRASEVMFLVPASLVEEVGTLLRQLFKESDEI